jgi:hypothetical protein
VADSGVAPRRSHCWMAARDMGTLRMASSWTPAIRKRRFYLQRLSQQDLMESSTHVRPTYSAAKFVFPYPEHSNSLRSEKSAKGPRTLPIAVNFQGPVSTICFGKPKASGAPMPEAPIHKYGNLPFGEPKVRPPGNRAWVHLPSAYRRSHKNESQSLLGRTVAHRSDLRHERASFACWESLQLPHGEDRR